MLGVRRASPPHSPSDTAAHTAASSRDRQTERNGPDPATSDRPRRIRGKAKKALAPHRPSPSAYPGGRTSLSQPRRSRESESHSTCPHARRPCDWQWEMELEYSYRTPLAFHQLQDQRSEDELHREVELRSMNHD